MKLYEVAIVIIMFFILMYSLAYTIVEDYNDRADFKCFIEKSETNINRTEIYIKEYRKFLKEFKQEVPNDSKE